MKIRPVISVTKWIVASVVYFAFCAWMGHLFIRCMLALAHGPEPGRWAQLEFEHFDPRVLDLGLFWGALYAGAFARPESFGRPARVWAHLACSYVLGLLGSAALIWAFMFSLPNWQSERAVYALLSFKFALAAICFVVAIGTWVRLAFGRLERAYQNRIAVDA